MNFDATTIRGLLEKRDFKSIFQEHLGWDKHSATHVIPHDGTTFTFLAVAEKRGFQVFMCPAIPEHGARQKLDRQLTKYAREHLVIYVSPDGKDQLWEWVRREPGKPVASRDYRLSARQSGDGLIQKLQALAMSLSEEEQLTLIAVTSKVKSALDVDKVTKRFYDRFKTEHAAFMTFIKGIKHDPDVQWYTSLMLNRLMFVYFIQKKGFLDGDTDYLRNRMGRLRQQHGKDKFHSFYRYFLLRLFHEGLGQAAKDRKPELEKLLGKVPFLNGGFFEVHQLEENNPDIEIPDKAFEKLFDFFESYRWHLDERPLRDDREINPDVVGYIFEKYINQKQMGAYYTKEDITEYISKNTIIPFLFDAAEKKCAIAFKPDSLLWRMLRDEPDRYIYAAVRHGVVTSEGDIIPLPAEIEAGITDVSKRGGWNKPAPQPFALPTETWREHVARRQRCLEIREKLRRGEVHQINDLITLNLDIWQFARDAIVNAEGPELLRAFYRVIAGHIPRHSNEKYERGMSVLDPTCGSGAFLFAALRILETLYSDCLERMRRFVDELEHSGARHRPEKYADLKSVLAEIEEHPNERYFVLKSIIINNLFGVDIMEEAVEICKLRLFLKLVAQVERVEQIEPLPDIDFNIRAGNTLVGYVSLEEVRRGQEGQLGFGDKELKRIEEDALIADGAYKRFRESQVQHAGTITAQDKAELRKRLNKLDAELDRYLAGEYGVKLGKDKGFDAWKTSHQPFHWLVEFFGIMRDGGFDAIIGNPPYLDLKAFDEYALRGFSTLLTKNLYPLVLERCQSISSAGRQGVIVPVSSVATEGYAALQKVLLSRRLVVSSYDDRPSHLFDGLDKNTLAILLLDSSGDEARSVHTSRLNRWNGDERTALFQELQFVQSEPCRLPGCIPKLGSAIEAAIWERLFAVSGRLADCYSRRENHRVYYSRKVNAFMQILDFVPRIRDGQGQLRPPSEFKPLYFDTAAEADAVLCLLNSSLFRWFMDVVSDGSHLNRRELDNFPFVPKIAAQRATKLTALARKLSDNLKRTSETRVMKYKHDTLTVQCIIGKHSKRIIDEIETEIGRVYGFTDEQGNYLVNYDIKYRMGGSDEYGDDD